LNYDKVLENAKAYMQLEYNHARKLSLENFKQVNEIIDLGVKQAFEKTRTNGPGLKKICYWKKCFHFPVFATI